MNIGFTTIATNVGVSFEWIVMIIFLCGGIIFAARDFKLALVMYFVGSAAIFMWFYIAGLNYLVPLVVMFMSLVLMSFSLYAVMKTQQLPGGGFI